MSTDNMHPIVRQFFDTAHECGIDIACMEVDIEQLKLVDPSLYELVCEYLDLEMEFVTFFQDIYDEDLYEQCVDPESIYSDSDDDDDDEEGEAWKNV